MPSSRSKSKPDQKRGAISALKSMILGGFQGDSGITGSAAKGNRNVAKKKKTTKSKKAQSASAKKSASPAKKTTASKKKASAAAKPAKAAKAARPAKPAKADAAGVSKKKTAAPSAPSAPSKKDGSEKAPARGKSVAGGAGSKGAAGGKAAAQPAEKRGRKASSKAVSDSVRAAVEGAGGLSAAEMHEELNFTPDYNEAGERICREVVCELAATTGDYCRLHYIKNWKRIKRKEMILKEGKLNRYIEELVAKYPDKYIEAIRTDLANDKDFAKVVSDLELDEAVDDFDMDSDSIDSLIDSIRRDIDEDTEF